jgi:carnitine-CoA ligase
MSRYAALVEAFPPRERTLPVMLTRQAERYGDRPLFTTDAVSWSYTEAREIAPRYAGTLAAAGVRPGERLAIMCSNRAELMQLFLGCAWLGAIAVPINVASRGPQLEHVLKNCGARLLALEADLADALLHVDISILCLEKIWLIGTEPPRAPLPLPTSPFPELGEAMSAGDVRPGQTVAILYTSGTTGPSKGVCCPQAQYFWWGVNTARLLGVREGDVLGTTLPLFHTNALNTFYQAMLLGASMALERRFSASGFWQALIRRRATVTYLLGAMVPILLSRAPSEEERAHQVRTVLAPGVPAHLQEEFARRTGITVIDGYGSTETNFVIGGTAEEQRPGTLGRVCEGFEAQVVDGEDNPVPPGEPGELLLRAREPFAFATGYFGMDDKTVAAWRNLWFHSGDRVVQDPDGYFRFIDRLKDAIRRRGENISSFEVEQVLASHPEVENVAVFPVQSELAEDEVMAAVVLRPGSTLSASALIEFCRPRLARFALPRFIEFVDALPVTENGKVQKYRLRERGVTARTWDREKAAAKA